MAKPVDTEERARRLTRPVAQRILDAARRLIADHGVQNSRVPDIAAAAHVATGQVHYYYGNKDGLLGAVAEADWTARRDRLIELLAPVTTLDDVVVALTTALAEHLAEPPGVHMASMEIATLALADAELQARLGAARDSYRDALFAQLARLVDAGVISPAADVTGAAVFLLALGRSLSIEIAADPAWQTAAAVALAERVTRRLLAV